MGVKQASYLFDSSFLSTEASILINALNSLKICLSSLEFLVCGVICNTLPAPGSNHQAASHRLVTE